METGYGDQRSLYEPPRKINYGWIGEAWSLFAAAPGVWIGATAAAFAPLVLAYAAFMVLTFYYGLMGPTGPHGSAGTSPPPPTPLLILALVLMTAVGAVTWYLTCGLHWLAVKQVRGEHIVFRDLFHGGPRFWRMVGLSILAGMAINVGFVLCIVPGLVIAGLLMPAYSMVADGADVFEAIKRSAEGMRQDLLNSTLLFLLLQLIVSAGASFFVGIIVVMPLYELVGALAYRDMIGMPGVAARSATPAPAPPSPDVWPPPPTLPS